jgi:hypothetical protein
MMALSDMEPLDPVQPRFERRWADQTPGELPTNRLAATGRDKDMENMR